MYLRYASGNDTTFQSFPSHLQNYLSEHIPPHLNFQVQTSLYPTYKSRKPLSNATENFLEWLNTQPPGPVILVGHSMGGLLVAEAATDPSILNKKPRRVVGMIAFDCPYLGMHPRVVVTGIASLLPKGEEHGKTEKEMNNHPDVTVVDNGVTDDWEKYKNAHDKRNASELSMNSTPAPGDIDKSPPRPQIPAAQESSSSLGIVGHSSPSGSLVDRTISFVSSHANDPLVKWIKKHHDAPISAGKQWTTEYFQFGSCMFDPTGLTARYKRLVAWNGFWVNYWTVTLPKKDSDGSSPQPDHVPSMELETENDVVLLETGVADSVSLDSSTHSPPVPLSEATTPSLNSQGSTSQFNDGNEKERKKAEKEREKELKRIRKEREKKAKIAAKAAAKANKERTGRHFVVLPTGLGAVLGGGDNWEQIVIGGVEDEVAAHCGMFIPGQNLDYEGLVERVGRRVIDWCEKL
ncbi:hypothetical protein E1B28_006377 [Marasmius oreades]|uniref:GPI inositol-deacylase n=1 Tax=Marasmius oreades TaxID=181124 RepID=A0A9P7UW51_9AGAR|nr:uncharacterized protein E1B28_006377 [Marasmius oreades]KAG7095656.1 hypothetical protein E1B28_006377 [Marasmius oreades]